MKDRLMLPSPHFPLKIFYDASCSVCSSEIEHYRSADHLQRLICIDISSAAFNPQEHGIPLEEFMYELHVIDLQGRVYRGVESFWAIWQALPNSTLYAILGAIIQIPVLRSVAAFIYKGFAANRRFLPKRKGGCANGLCHQPHDGKYH